MNTLLAFSAVLASIWVSIYAFDDLGEPALGTVMLGVAFAWLIVSVMAASDDWEILSGGQDEEAEE